MFRVALRLLLAAALGAVPSLARADVYRWVDDAGATHYATSRDGVPSAYRDAAVVIPPLPATIPNPSDARPPQPPPAPRAAEPAPRAVEPASRATETPGAVEQTPRAATPTAPVQEPAPATAEPSLAPTEPPPALSSPATSSPSAAPAESPPSAAPPSGREAAPPPIAAPSSPQSSAPVSPESRRAADPRNDEISQLEGQIERDREVLRELVSTPRWDSSELASDPRVREIAERLPRLQAELAALRTEAEH